MVGSWRSRSANRRASRQQRSTSSATPLRPSEAQRGVDGEAARAPRRLRRPVHRLARLVRRSHQVGGADAHRRAMRRRMRGEHQPGVVGHVQPLVRVGRAGVGALDAADVVAQRIACRRPQAERAIDVQPRAVRRGEIGDGVDRIERARVHVAGLRADNRRAALRLQRRGQRIRLHPALIVGCDAHQLARAESDQPQRADRGRVHFVADHHAHARCALQAIRLDVPAGAAQQLVARGRERGEVRHVATGDEADAGAGGQSEELEQPAPRGLLDDRRRGRHHVEAGVLIPRRSEPLGGDRSPEGRRR